MEDRGRPVIAHVGGFPVEEAVPALATWAGAGLYFARGWWTSRKRRALSGRSIKSARR
jgi:hypothetical protein